MGRVAIPSGFWSSDGAQRGISRDILDAQQELEHRVSEFLDSERQETLLPSEALGSRICSDVRELEEKARDLHRMWVDGVSRDGSGEE